MKESGKKSSPQQRDSQIVPESQIRYKALFDQSPDGILLIDTEGKILEFNDSAHLQLGYSREEFTKLRITDIDSSESNEDIQDRIGKVSIEGKVEFEVKHRTKKGELRDVLIITQPIVTSDRTVFHTIWRDITERKRAEAMRRQAEEELKRHRVRLEEAVQERTADLGTAVDCLTEEVKSRNFTEERLRKSEGEFRKLSQDFHVLLDAITDSLLVVSPDLKVLWANRGAAAGVRMTEGALIGKYCYELWHHRFTACDDCYALRSFGSGKADGSIIRSFNGTLSDVRSFPIIGDEGKVDKVLIVGLDITEKAAKEAEHRRAKEELREAEQKYRIMIEHSNDLIWMSDKEGLITYVNKRAEEISGYRTEELVGKSYFSIIPVPDLLRIEAIFKETINGKSQNYEVELRKHDGSVLILSVNTTPFLKATEIVGSVSFGRDITDQKKAEKDLEMYYRNLEIIVQERTKELEKAFKDLESFSYAASHDLKAPIRRIRDFSRILREDYVEKLDSQPADILKRIENNSEQMSQLIEDLLSFSRISTGELRKTEVDMAGLTRRAYDELKTGMEHDQQVSVKIKTMPTAFGDPSMLYQVILNLLSNAAKFARTRAAAFIEIGGETEQGDNVYYVKDNGIGFDMQFSDKLFGLFQRIHVSKIYEGTGIGLVIVKKIIEKHDGRVWAEGKPDEGAVFYFSLPNKTMILNDEVFNTPK